MRPFFSSQNILKKAEENSERETSAIKAHQQLEQVSQGAGPTEGAVRMVSTE